MTLPLRPIAQAAALAAFLACGGAQADTGKLVLTGGVSSITGSAGGRHHPLGGDWNPGHGG